MKIVIFLKNNYNDYITISSNDNLNLDEKVNINYEILKIVRSNLKKQNKSLSQFKCIDKSKDIYYFIVKVDTIESYVELSGFINKAYSDKNKNAEKLKKYKRKINKSKHFAVLNAFFSKFKIKDLIVFIFELLFLSLSIYIKYTEKSNNGANFLLISSLVLILISSLEKITKSFFDSVTFNKTCTFSSTFNYSKELDITSEIKEQVIKNYKLSKNYERFNHINLNNNETFIYSDEENTNLKNNAKHLKVEKVNSPNVLNNSSRTALAHIIGSKLNDDKTIFNGKLLGINSELNFNANQTLQVKKVRYHHYVSIDEMIYRNIFTPFTSSKVIKGKDVCLNPLTNSLMDIKNSHLTNLIGINLIVELHHENKIYYLVNDQSLYNDVNQERLVPTSSGSLDQDDYKLFKKFKIDNQNFENLLSIGMLRELYEESYLFFENNNGLIQKKKDNILDLEIVNFNLLGCARLVSKAGKPDFFAKLVLKSSKDSIINDILENYKNYQNKYLGTKKSLETIKLRVIEKEELFSKDSNNFSPQLQYTIYLLKNE